MEGKRDLEIVGLLSGTNGRTCCMHDICGSYVQVGDILRLKKCVVETRPDVVEDAIQCVRIVDGVESCKVAFIPRSHMHSKRVMENINGYIQVTDLYSSSSNAMKRRKSQQNRGIAGCVFLQSIPIGE